MHSSATEHVMRRLAGQAIMLANSQSLAEARRLSRQRAEALASRDDVARATGVLYAERATSEQDTFAPGGLRPAGRPPRRLSRIVRGLFSAGRNPQAHTRRRCAYSDRAPPSVRLGLRPGLQAARCRRRSGR